VYFCGKGAGAGANLGGVWVTINFTAPSVATQPTWVKLNVTGSWPANNYIRSFGVDINAPAEYLYALTGQVAGGDVIRYTATTGTWDTILTNAAVRATYTATTDIQDMMVDPVTGYLNVLAISENAGLNQDYHIGYRCLDPTAAVPVWTSIASPLYQRQANGTLWVYNDSMTYCNVRSTLPKQYFSISAAGGAWASTLMNNSLTNTSSHFRYKLTNPVFYPYTNTNHMGYFAVGGAAASGVARCSAAAPIDCLESEIVHVSTFMGDPDNAGTLRFVGNNSSWEGHLITTTDNFVTYTDRGHLDIGTRAVPYLQRKVDMIADVVNEDFYAAIIYGSNDPVAGIEHTIFAAEGDTDITPEGKSGAHPDTGVDSIHYLADGPCWRGIQVVPGT
jgi:hypothetical protein